MSDHSKLKQLAEAATKGKWCTDGERKVMSAESDQLNSGFVIVDCQGPDNLKNAAFIAAANPAAVLALIAESETRRIMIKEMDLMFGRYILAMRSALIEEEHGKGPVAAMEWIYNSLVGPGQLPPDGETDAQAYFNREIVAVNTGMEEVLKFHEAQRAANKVTP